MGREERVRFQNNNTLKLGVARRHAVWDHLFTSRDRMMARGGRGRLDLFTFDVTRPSITLTIKK